MPVINGFEATRQIRRLPRIGNQVKIVAISDSAFGEHRQLSLDAGCDGFLARPFTMNMLFDEHYDGRGIAPWPETATALANSVYSLAAEGWSLTDSSSIVQLDR